MERSTDIDLLVIGGGLLGMCVAFRAAERKLRVLVCRLSDVGIPQADTLRNQAWLQSGLRYVGGSEYDGRALLAKRMLAGGYELYDALGLRRPRGFGIVRLKNEEDGQGLEKDADRLGVTVIRLEEIDVAPCLGELFTPGSVYYATPEVRFDEPMLLRRLREAVKDYGGFVRELEGPLELVPDDSVQPHGFYIKLRGQRINPPGITVLAAGAGNVPLLRQLRLDGQHKLQLFRTPLLVLPMTFMQDVQVFQDRVREFSIVSHPPSYSSPEGATVIGATRGTRTDFRPARERRIPRQDCETFWRIDCFAKYQALGRFTAGFEVGVNGTERVHHWVELLPHFHGLVAAIPGRATVCMSVASELIEKLAANPSNSALSNFGTEWTAPIFMHYESHYENLNDAADL